MILFDNPRGVPAPPPGRYSHVARVELGERTMLFLSGQVAVDADGKVVGEGDMAAQTECVMDAIATILGAHGATFADVVTIRTYLTDMSRLAEYGEARRPRFGDAMPPTSTTVEVSGLFIAGALLEVEVTAVV